MIFPRTRQHPIVTIARDPFARMDHIRQSAGPGECHYCGSQRKTVYRYGTHDDGLNTRPYLSPHTFCSVACYRAYSY